MTKGTQVLNVVRPYNILHFVEIANITMEQDPQQTSICDLPESCISLILSRTCVKDVCRCALISKLFYRAAISDTVWITFLPKPYQYQLIISIASIPISFSSKFQLFKLLSDAIPVENSSKLIWLEKNSGKISHRQSARSLSIVWGNDDRYWNWVADDNSRFGEVAELKSVCWLEIRGCVDCRLLSANTTYKLSFVVKFSEKRFFGFSAGPVILCVTLPDGQAIKSGRLLQEREGAHIDPEMKVSLLENAQNGWSYLVAGTFLVEHDWTLESSGSPTVVYFSMLETHSSRWKTGLIVDGVQIEPL